MLFDYLVSGVQPDASASVWSHEALQPMFAGALTPLSYSVLAELTSRSWYAYYDQLGFNPTPRSRVLRQHQGRAYLNMSSFARLEAEQAGIEPLTCRINQQAFPLAQWEKPGLLGGFKFNRAQKKVEQTLSDFAARMPAITDKARNWYIKTQELRWTQAEVLQVMEEIERIGVDSMAAFLAARHNLAWLYGKILSDLDGHMNYDQALLLINNALCDMHGLVESDIADAVIALGETMRDEEHLAWLKHGDFGQWRETLPSKQAANQFAEFMTAYGHRTMHEGEMTTPRWVEDPRMVARSLLVFAKHPTRHPSQIPTSGSVQKLVDGLPDQKRKQGKELIRKVRKLQRLQSQALHALAYIWAGTRRWALAAAHEAMADERIQSEEDIFFFELEEVKQMMTGEWNVSHRDKIQDTAAQRRTAHAAWKQEPASEILLGDHPGWAAHQGVAGVAGHVTGPLRRWVITKKNGCSGAILGGDVLDSGWALALPLGDGFVAAGNMPYDPFVVAARSWHHPVMVGLGDKYRQLVEGAHTTLDVTPDRVEVSQ